MTTKILYSIGSIFRAIFSFLGRMLKKLFTNWDKKRKILVVLVFIFVAIKQLASPETQKALNSGLQVSMLDLENQANAYAHDYDFEHALTAYESCLKMIVSQQNLENISTPLDVQQRICTNAAYTFLEYSFGKKLNESDEKLKNLIISGLELQKKLGVDDDNIDVLISRLNKR